MSGAIAAARLAADRAARTDTRHAIQVSGEIATDAVIAPAQDLGQIAFPPHAETVLPVQPSGSPNAVALAPAAPMAQPSGLRTLFSATNGSNGTELWITDGTAAGTQMLMDIYPGFAGSGTKSFQMVDGKIVFVAGNAASGSELWTTDGTAAGTHLLKDINPGTAASSISNFVALGSKLIFAATDATNGRELWVTDGTAAGTTVLKDIFPGSTASNPSNLVAFNGKLVFAATDATGFQLWQTDGTAAGTTKITSITSLSVGGLTPAGDKLVFSGKSGADSNYELWVTDGTAAGTTVLKEIAAGSTGSFPNAFAAFGDKAIFVASPNDPIVGETWITDGTAAGTFQLSTVQGSNFTPFGTKMIFSGGGELWMTDGTAAGTALVKDINPGGVSSPQSFFEFDGKMYFRASDGTSGAELWVTDGTTAGTQMLKDINPGALDSLPVNFAQFGSQFLFSAQDANGRELWISDGTDAGTMLLKNINPGTSGSSPNNFFTYTVDTDDAPVLGVNGGSTVLEGGTGTITAAQLSYDDSDTDAAAITYTITTAVTNGTLFRDGVTLGLNATFTQADIDNGLVTYTHDGGETASASFGFSISDGTTTTAGQSFAFTVTPVNDAPAVSTTALDASFVERADHVQTGAVSVFSGTSVDTGEAGQAITQVTFTITGLVDAANDHLLMDGAEYRLGGYGSLSGGTPSGYAIAISISGTTATVTITSNAGMTPAAAQTLIDSIGYTNVNIDNPSAGDRVFTLTSITDNGGTADGGVNTAALSIASTVQVVPTNDSPVFGLAPIALASTSATGVQGNSVSNTAQNANGRLQMIFTADGNSIVFSSTSTNLVSDDTNGQSDVFLKNLVTGAITRVSTSASGAQGSGSSTNASISADGTKVVFYSISSNLVAGDTSGAGDIFLKDLTTGAITIVSSDATGAQGNGTSLFPSLSANGNVVVFLSSANNLVAGDTNGAADYFAKNLTTGGITRVTTDSNGNQVSPGTLTLGGISADGTKVVFTSTSSGFVSGDTNGRGDVFVKNLVTGEIVRVSTDSAGAQQAPGGMSSTISADGLKVAFVSSSATLVDGDTNGAFDLFVKDLVTGAVTRVNTDSQGNQTLGTVGTPAFSPDGTKIAFTSTASTLAPGGTGGFQDIFVKDLVTGAVTRVSVSTLGISGNASSFNPVFSPDGSKIGFESLASNLVPIDTNGERDVFVVPLSSPAATFVENGSAVQVAANNGISDIDSANFGDGVFTAAITGGGVTGDSLSLVSSTITVSDMDVSYGGTLIGTLTQTATSLSIALNANATSEAATALIQAVRFASTADDLGASRTVTFTLNDGAGAATTSYERTVNITSVNGAPTTANIAGDIAIHAANTYGYTLIDVGHDATIADLDSANFDGGSLHVALTGGAVAGEDELLALSNAEISFTGDTEEIIVGGVSIGTFTHAPDYQSMDFSFNANATPAAVQEVLRALNYYGSGATLGDRTVSFTLVDGDGGDDTVTFTSTLRVAVPLNAAPVLDLDSTAGGTGASVTALEDDFPIIAPNATLTDGDSPNFDGGSLTVSFGADGTATDAFSLKDEGGMFATGGRIGISSGNVYYDTVQIGTITSWGLGQPLIVTFNASASPVAVQALLHAIGAGNISDTPPVGPRTLTFTVTDGDGGSSSATADLAITPVNDAPVIANLQDDTITATENTNTQPFYDLGQNAVITDADSANFNGGSLTVAVTGGLVVNADRVALIQNGIVTLTSSDGYANSTVLVNGVVVGTVQNAYQTNNLVINFTTDDATAARVQAVLRQIAYVNTSDNSTAGTRTLTTTLIDGDGTANGGSDRNSYTTTVDVIATNDAPTHVVPGAQTTAEDTAKTFGYAGNNYLYVQDADAGGNAIQVTIGVAHGALTLGRTDGLTFGTGDGTGDVTMTFTGTLSDINSALNNLSYMPDANYNGADTLTFTSDDLGNSGTGGAKTTTSTVAIDVAAVNDAPVLSGGGNAIGYTENASNVVVNAAIAVSDVDNANLTGATVTIGGKVAGDILSFVDQNGITGSFDAATGVLTLSGSASAADYRAALQSVAFSSTSDDPTAHGASPTRTISFAIDDGEAANHASAPVATTVNVTAVNDAPSSTGFDDVTFVEGQPYVQLDTGFDQILTDPDSLNFDGGTLTFSVGANKVATEDQLTFLTGGTSFLAVSGNMISYHGVTFATFTPSGVGLDRTFTFNANATTEAVQTLMRNLAYFNANQLDPSTAPRTMDYVLTDGDGGTLTLHSTITIVAVNEEPSGADAAFTINEDATYTFSAASFGFDDAEGDSFDGVVVTTLTAPGSLYLDADGAGGQAPVAVVAGTFVSAADIALGRLTFVPATDGNGSPYTSFTFQVRDDAGTANGGQDTDQSANTITFNVSAENDAPTISAPQSTVMLEDQVVDLGTYLTIADVDAATLTVTLSVAHGTLTLPDTTGLTFSGGTDGNDDATITFTGTPAAINAAINYGLVYVPVADYHGDDALSITVSDNGETGAGGIKIASTSVAITINSVNDAPSGTDATVTASEDDPYVFVLADFGFSDPVDGDGFNAVSIQTFPGQGTLFLDVDGPGGAAPIDLSNVGAGVFVSAADIAAGRLYFQPDADDYGAGYASFTFKVQDDGGLANGGVDRDPTANTITIDVTADNFVPQATSLSTPETYVEDTQMRLATIMVTDTDPGDTITATLTLSDLAAGTLTTGTSGAVTSTFIGGVWTASGSVADVNKLLLKVRFDPADDFNGNFSIATSITDGVSAPVTGTKAFTGTPVNDAPAGADSALGVSRGERHVVTAAEFGFSDTVDGDAFDGVTITSLPTAGRLFFDGLKLTASSNLVISAADIAAGKLTYQPALGGDGAPTASFTFKVHDDGGTANGGVDTDPAANTVTYNVVNRAPTGSDGSVAVTLGNIHVMTLAEFGFADADGNAFASVTIDTLPAAGRLFLNGVKFVAGTVITAADIAAGKLSYNPGSNPGDPAQRSFTFQVHDDGGTAFGGTDTDATPNTLTFDTDTVGPPPRIAGPGHALARDAILPGHGASALFDTVTTHDTLHDVATHLVAALDIGQSLGGIIDSLLLEDHLPMFADGNARDAFTVDADAMHSHLLEGDWAQHHLL